MCIYVYIYTCFIFLSILPTPPHLFFRRKLLRGNVSHGGQHGNSAMLQLSLATSLEVLNTAISGKACWIPKSRWRLNAQLVLECGPHNLRSKCLQNTKLFFCPKKLFLTLSAFTSKSYLLSKTATSQRIFHRASAESSLGLSFEQKQKTKT